MNNLANYIAAVQKKFPGRTMVDRSELDSVTAETGNNKGFMEFYKNFKISRGNFRVPEGRVEAETIEAPAAIPATAAAAIITGPMKLALKTDSNLVPQKDSEFVPFGDFKLIQKFISSKMFYPIYISGESGNGKTKMVYEACARAGRELVRANITELTDEDDLIGGFRLVNGDTVWQDGPAVEAMKRGAVLLLDEVNLGSAKIMCLQPILEGNPIYVKKINQLVVPSPGFTVIATANTKGQGSDDGRYIGSNIMNEAFLDRFAVTIEHDYPSKEQEEKILLKLMAKNNMSDDESKVFAKKLVEWAEVIRKTFKEGGIEEVITTRRLIHILNFFMHGKRHKMSAIDYCISRFDEETKVSMKSLYRKIDETVDVSNEAKTNWNPSDAEAIDA